jgi:hypothetical protein
MGGGRFNTKWKQGDVQKEIGSGLYAVKHFPNRDMVQTKTRLARGHVRHVRSGSTGFRGGAQLACRPTMPER